MLDFGSKDLLIPIIMVIFGLVLKFIPPSKINSFYGYRTTTFHEVSKSMGLCTASYWGLVVIHWCYFIYCYPL